MVYDNSKQGGNMKLSEIIAHVSSLSLQINAHSAEVRRTRIAGRTIIWASEDWGPSAPEWNQLKDFLRTLPAATIYMLTTIMYLGRGDCDVKNMLEEYTVVSNDFRKPEWAAKQMMGKKPLAKYLAAGLAALAEANLDVDQLL
jgi:Protein of unknown function (DUF3775)